MAFIKYIPLLLFTLPAKAQLFGQAGKQKQYYEQQIAAYNALQSEIRQGYIVIKKVLGGIRDINTAELNAHTAYYQSLNTPSSAVKNNRQVKDIISYQNDISRVFSQPFNGLTADELVYVTSVKNEVLQACTHDLTDLQTLLVAGSLKVSDEERLKRLNAIHASMLDKDEFSRSFIASVKLLAMHRQQETNDAQSLTSLYENH